ncbi:hypothetical protein Leryth_015272 [Lithospermum erythrorhizon]|nr:hypothetical protein Leryth_015272 [Lithospermum erythrorhizon]
MTVSHAETSPSERYELLRKMGAKSTQCIRPIGTLLLCCPWRWRNRLGGACTTMFSWQGSTYFSHVRENTVQELLDYCKNYSLRNEAVDLSIAAFMTTLNGLTSTIFSKNVMDPKLESSIRHMRDYAGILQLRLVPNLADFMSSLTLIFIGIKTSLDPKENFTGFRDHYWSY